jgi:ubiquinone/menaquinone biosynthesis C-methylase UbiE
MTAPAEILQAVSDHTRLRLLRLLCREELNVQELVRILGMNQPRVSKHLGILRDAGWLRQRREGTWSWYRAVDRRAFPGGEALFDSVTAVADAGPEAREDDAELASVLAGRDAHSRDFFAGIAGRWDEIRRSYEHPDLQLGAVAALVDESLEVIDIGTGTGALLPLLAAATGRICAVDNSPAMLARARALCERSGLSQVSFQRADIQALPFADASFDAAYCSMALHHVARPARAVAEMARVVRPRGKVVVIAFTRHNLAWMREELAHQWLGFDRDEIEQHFRDAGLELRRHLVRQRRPGDEARGEGAGRGRGRTTRWPDVFLATGVKRDPVTTEDRRGPAPGGHGHADQSRRNHGFQG